MTSRPEEGVLLDDPFRTLADAAPVMVWLADASGHRLWCNRSWRAFTGRSLPDDSGTGWLDGVHPDDRGRCADALLEGVATGGPVELEYRLRRHDGAHRWVLDRAVPLVQADGRIGGYVGGAADVDDLKRAEAVRNQLLDAEREARAEAEDAARLLGRLQAITAAFSAAPTAEEVYDVVAAEAMAAAAADAVSLFRREPATLRLRMVRAIGYPDEVLDRHRVVPAGSGMPIARAVRSRSPVFVDADAFGDEYASVAASTEGGLRAAAALPLIVRGEPFGAVGLGFRAAQTFPARTREFLVAVANQCAAALERAQLYEAERAGRRAAEEAREQLSFLAEATRLLGSSLDASEVVARLCQLGVPRLGDVAAIWAPRNGVLQRLAVARNHDDGDGDVQRHPPGTALRLDGASPEAVCYRTGEVQLRGRDDDGGGRRDLVVPLWSRHRVLGVMAFGLADPSRTYSDGDVDVARELGARAGVAIDNASTYEHEHSVAEILQHAVLPEELPLLPGYELAARYLPATTDVEVGGDWFDAFHLRDGRLGIVVGDVAGHGVRAAATMGQLRNALRAYALDGDPPGEVLRRLNRHLVDTEREAYATALYATLDPETGAVAWCNGGHLPPVVGTGDGAGTVVDGDVSLVLGVDGLAAFTSAHTTLAPGDTFLLYTDGLVERRSEHLDTGLERLRAAIAEAGTATVQELCASVLVATRGDIHRSDDVCLLALRRVSGAVNPRP